MTSIPMAVLPGRGTTHCLNVDSHHCAATNYMQYTAHQTVPYALDQREYLNPNNGQIVNASNRFNTV